MAVKEVIGKQISKQYPVAEVFTSPQGEGCYAGQMQTFIRLAGCTVGKPYTKEKYMNMGVDISSEVGGGSATYLPLPIYTEKCTLYDGREFACDTDYRKHESHTAEELMQMIPAGVDHVCITGGEPLMHNLSPLITYMHGIGRIVHIETSGTIFDSCILPEDIWVTVSPKLGVLASMLGRANEIKILVDKDFDLERPIPIDRKSVVYLTSLAFQKPVFLQPVNGEHTVSAENLRLCRKWQDKYPAFRVSVQLHKVMSMILGEEIR
jgi:7-carboxy-7-deazaguanine synthase